jgi:hypothetical protein
LQDSRLDPRWPDVRRKAVLSSKVKALKPHWVNCSFLIFKQAALPSNAFTPSPKLGARLGSSFPACCELRCSHRGQRGSILLGFVGLATVTDDGATIPYGKPRLGDQRAPTGTQWFGQSNRSASITQGQRATTNPRTYYVTRRAPTHICNPESSLG